VIDGGWSNPELFGVARIRFNQTAFSIDPSLQTLRQAPERDLPYYEIESFRERGPSSPAGTLAQGTSLIPCLVIRDGQALTDRKGTPYVGFRILVDPRQATPAATDKFKRASARRKSLRVANHHCDGRVRHVIKVRQLYALNKAPFFDPPGSGDRPPKGDPK